MKRLIKKRFSRDVDVQFCGQTELEISDEEIEAFHEKAEEENLIKKGLDPVYATPSKPKEHKIVEGIRGTRGIFKRAEIALITRQKCVKTRENHENALKIIDGRRKICYNNAMIQKRAIAFDIGDKRIGVAISDPFNEYAMPCETYFRTRDLQADAKAVAEIIQARGVGIIVCGMPVNYDGTESVQTGKTQTFIDALKTYTHLPIELEDERFTTMQARETQMAGGIKREDRKKTIDSIAASYILESWLHRKKIQEQKEKDMKDEIQEGVYDEEDRIIELEDDEGNSEKFLHIATIEYGGVKYCVFQKAEPETEEEEDEVVIFSLDEEQGMLNPLEDEQLLDEVFAEFCNQYEQFEDSEDAMRLDK
jgi:putative Holliday junction resolvase